MGSSLLQGWRWLGFTEARLVTISSLPALPRLEVGGHHRLGDGLVGDEGD